MKLLLTITVGQLVTSYITSKKFHTPLSVRRVVLFNYLFFRNAFSKDGSTVRYGQNLRTTYLAP